MSMSSESKIDNATEDDKGQINECETNAFNETVEKNENEAVANPKTDVDDEGGIHPNAKPPPGSSTDDAPYKTSPRDRTPPPPPPPSNTIYQCLLFNYLLFIIMIYYLI